MTGAGVGAIAGNIENVLFDRGKHFFNTAFVAAAGNGKVDTLGFQTTNQCKNFGILIVGSFRDEGAVHIRYN